VPPLQPMHVHEYPVTLEPVSMPGNGSVSAFAIGTTTKSDNAISEIRTKRFKFIKSL